MRPRLLSEREYRATFVPPMRDITGHEDLEQPGGVIDLAPYLAALSPGDLEGLALLLSMGSELVTDAGAVGFL